MAPLIDVPNLIAINRAIVFLHLARDALRDVDCAKAADAVARALKSAEGAKRHAQGLAHRERVTP